MKETYAIVGCGKVGIALARQLAEAGYRPAGFASRTLSSAKKASEAAGGNAFFTTQPRDITDRAEIVFITTPDGLIKQTAEKLAGDKCIAKDTVVLHCSGALASTEMEVLTGQGAHIGGLHPLQSFAEDSPGKNPFAGIMMAVEGGKKAVQTAWQIAESLGSKPFAIQTDKKKLYHASAVVASNYLVTLMNLSLNLLEASGVLRKDAWAVLKPLVDGTLGNIEKTGIPDALTGPIARGDVETVEGHLFEIKEKAPSCLELYRLLASHTIEIARAKGGLSEDCQSRLSEILAPDSKKQV